MNHVLPLAVAQFRRDLPLVAARFDSMREKAAAQGASLRDTSAAGAEVLSSIPHGNHGDNVFEVTV